MRDASDLSLAGDVRGRPPGSRGWVATGLCTLALLLSVLATDPRAEIGLHDDWSYIYSALVLAKTGHVVYNGWSTAMLGWQLYLGAFFIRTFGFSFTVVRASGLLIALLTVPLVHRLLLRFGVLTWNATLGTLTFVMSPLYLPLAASSMSDIPSLLCVLVCLYGCLRAVQADTDRAAVAWLVFAAVTNLLGGTVRQIAWLGVLVMLPATAWYLRRRRWMVAASAALWFVSLVAVLAMLHWYNQQPYAAVEQLLGLRVDRIGLAFTAKLLAKSAFTMSLLVLPVLVAFAGRCIKNRDARRRAYWALALIATCMAPLSYRHGGLRWLTRLLVGNYVSAKGILDIPWFFAMMPDVVPRPVGALIAFSVFGTVTLCALWLHASGAMRVSRLSLLGTPVFWLLGPFSLAYFVLIATRALIFDRYLLPLIFALLVWLLRLYERRVGGRMSWVCAVPLVLLALYGVAGTHDVFAISRARLQAANEIRASGVPRSAIAGGFEYDGWTQIEMTGHVNEPRVHTPASAYVPWQPPADIPVQCLPTFAAYTPSLRPRYFLSNRAGLCYPASALPPVAYRSWLPRHEHSIYIVEKR